MKKTLLTALFAFAMISMAQAKECPMHAATKDKTTTCSADQKKECRLHGKKCDGSCIKKNTNTSMIQAVVGESAPDFTLPASSEKNVSLSSYTGKIVVLEWFNEGCPFVKKHYNSGNMQALQAKYTKEGVVWLSVVSSARGNQGYMKVKDAKKYIKKNKTEQNAILFDESGDVGKLYGARTTPHMFIIDKDGTVAYAGAIDDKASFKEEDVKNAKNYVADALDELLAGKKVTNSQTEPYGCSVKYR